MIDIPDSVRQLYDQVQNSGLVAGPDRFSKLLKECFAKFSKVFVLLDAFDECVEDERAKILKALQHLPESNLRLFITSRTRVDNDRLVREDSELKKWVQTAVVKQIAASLEDVEMCLKERIEENARDLDEEIKQKMVTTIASKIDGQYSYCPT